MWNVLIPHYIQHDWPGSEEQRSSSDSTWSVLIFSFANNWLIDHCVQFHCQSLSWLLHYHPSLEMAYFSCSDHQCHHLWCLHDWFVCQLIVVACFSSFCLLFLLFFCIAHTYCSPSLCICFSSFSRRFIVVLFSPAAWPHHTAQLDCCFCFVIPSAYAIFSFSCCLLAAMPQMLMTVFLPQLLVWLLFLPFHSCLFSPLAPQLLMLAWLQQLIVVAVGFLLYFCLLNWLSLLPLAFPFFHTGWMLLFFPAASTLWLKCLCNHAAQSPSFDLHNFFSAICLQLPWHTDWLPLLMLVQMVLLAASTIVGISSSTGAGVCCFAPLLAPISAVLGVCYHHCC